MLSSAAKARSAIGGNIAALVTVVSAARRVSSAPATKMLAASMATSHAEIAVRRRGARDDGAPRTRVADRFSAWQVFGGQPIVPYDLHFDKLQTSSWLEVRC